MTRTWYDVQKFIDEHELPYQVQVMNGVTWSGVLVDTFTQKSVCYTVKDAFKHFKCL